MEVVTVVLSLESQQHGATAAVRGGTRINTRRRLAEASVLEKREGMA